MLNRWFGHKAHYFLHVLGMTLLAVGLPLNKVVISIGSIWGVSNLVLMGDYKTTFRKVRQNKVFLVWAAFFALHIIGLLWSENLEYGLTDIRKKLPLLALPLAFAGGPEISKNIFNGYFLPFQHLW